MSRFSTVRRAATAFATVAVLSGCASAPVSTDINDPYEAQNRRVHEFNKSLDQALVRPASKTYGSIVPPPVAAGIGNFADNVGMPSTILNNLLQADISAAMNNSLRFVLNTTVGLGGVFDPADGLGLFEESADFGQTLHAWGFGEGPYQELPLIGPSTRRDTAGMVVDFVLDPMNWYLPANLRYVATASRVLSRINDRNTFASTVDSLLYQSEDSYAQERLLYLQNRRYNLGGGLSESDYEDPYAE